MASTYTTNKKYDKQGSGDNVGAWAAPLNANFDLIDENLAGSFSIALSNVTYDISQPDSEHLRLVLSGTLLANVAVRLPATYSGFWIVDNQTSGAFSVTVKTTDGSSVGVAVDQGYTSLVFCDGTDVKFANSRPPTGIAASGVAVTPPSGYTATNLQTAVDQLAVRARQPGELVWAAGLTATTGTLLCDGSAVNRTTYANLFAYLVTAAGYTSQTFTITIASPAVVTKSGHGFVGGERLRLSTTGSLPTGLNTTTDYYVEVINSSTFYLSATPGGSGTRVNTSGSQSGTQSYLRSIWGLGNGTTTFNVPDYRGYFVRGLDLSRGIDVNRIAGGFQAGQNLAHTHTGNTDVVPDHSHAISAEQNSNFSGSGSKTGLDDLKDGTAGNVDRTSGLAGGYPSGIPFTTGSSGGSEVRPANLPAVICVVY